MLDLWATFSKPGVRKDQKTEFPHNTPGQSILFLFLDVRIAQAQMQNHVLSSVSVSSVLVM